jgi:hypothetical protein
MAELSKASAIQYRAWIVFGVDSEQNVLTTNIRWPLGLELAGMSVLHYLLIHLCFRSTGHSRCIAAKTFRAPGKQ